MKAPQTPQTFGFLVKDVSRLSVANFERHAEELGLTLTQCKVLAHLHRNEGVSQIRLAELTETDPMTLVRILDRMEEQGWIERRAHETDRRARKLFLRRAAVPIVNRIWEFADRARSEALAGLSAKERDKLMSLLERVHANLVEIVGSKRKEAA
ncbi:MAG TPA: MarR family transcriptional regulator [Nevskiaceae bacterium]|nr:MarR family transcriptional regulator [Nevskiaceae bacterium]